MRAAFVRLALFQMTFVVYCVLGIGLILKVRYGTPAPTNLLATHVRDLGFLLLLLPAAWSVWVIYKLEISTTDRRTSLEMIKSGFVVVGALAIIALLATGSAICHKAHAEASALSSRISIEE